MIQNQTMNQKRIRQRGNALVEFALVSVVLTPLLLSTVSLGMNLSRSIQVTQVVRDAGHMYARWVDFSLASNKQLIVRLSSGLGMTAAGGNGVVILTKVTYIADNDCTGAGLTLAQCTNRGQYVIMNRVTIGNPSFHTSAFGTPTPSGLDTNGDVLDYLRDTSARSANFNSLTLLTLGSGEFAFVAEGFYQGLSWSIPDLGVGNQLASRAVF
jgi:hypothetical protein